MSKIIVFSQSNLDVDRYAHYSFNHTVLLEQVSHENTMHVHIHTLQVHLCQSWCLNVIILLPSDTMKVYFFIPLLGHTVFVWIIHVHIYHLLVPF